MKRFVARKTIKVKRYKLIYVILFLSISLIVFLNMFLNFSLKKIDRNSFYNLFIGNAYGNIFNKYNMYNNKESLFYKNMFGFSFNDSKSTLKEENNLGDIINNTEPLIYLYNTFQTAKYINPYYNTYSINPVITQANLILQEYLKNYQINSLVETKSVAKTLKENNIDYTLSYRGSRILLEMAKKENNSLEYFFDIGMSDNKKEVTTTKIDGDSYAKIMFIVGTLNNNYLDNQALAQSLNNKLIKINEGLSSGVSLRGGAGYHGVYNQDFSSNCLLIYVGGKENSIEEVNRSLRVLASIISDYISEVQNEKE